MPGNSKRPRMETVWTADEDDTMEKHDSVFEGPIQLFKNAPINTTFIEYKEEELLATPAASPLADTYTFISTAQPTGLIQLNKVRLSAKLQILRANDTATVADQDCVLCIAAPLRTMWKTISVKCNSALINAESNHEGHLSNLKLQLREIPSKFKQTESITMKIFDESGHFDHNAGNANGVAVDAIGTGYCTHTAAGLGDTLSLAARKRHSILTNPGAPIQLIDRPDIPLFENNGEDRYLPSSFHLEIKMVRRDIRQILMGSQLPNVAANAIAGQKIAITDFKMHFPIFKPNEQLREALNESFIQDKEEAKYYTSEYRVIVNGIAENVQTHQVVDIFNGSLPSRLFIMMIATANFDGSYTTNPHNYKWFNLNKACVLLNSTIVKPIIENSKEAYVMLQNMLNRKYGEMPFPYEKYEDGNAIIGFDLCPNRDSFHQTLPTVTTGNLSVDLGFSQAIPAGGIRVLLVGEFRNQYQLSYKQEARKIYVY